MWIDLPKPLDCRLTRLLDKRNKVYNPLRGAQPTKIRYDEDRDVWVTDTGHDLKIDYCTSGQETK